MRAILHRGPRRHPGTGAGLALPLAVALLLIAPLAASATRSEPRPPPSAAITPAPEAPPRAAHGPSRPAGGPAFVPGEVIVGYRPRAGRSDRVAARAATRTVLERRLEAPRAELLRIEGDRPPERVAAALDRLPEVAYAQPNHYRQVSSAPSDPELEMLWGLRNTGQVVRSMAGVAGADISAVDAWAITTGGEVTVAVADTGIDAAHPDLASNVTGDGWDFVDDDADPHDEHGHGTHVAGTIGAVGDNGIGVAGVAWDVSLMPVRVLDADGVGTDQQVADGFKHAADSGAQIVNASLGGEGESPLIDEVIAEAPETLFVIAAGNSGSDNDAEPQFPCNSPNPNVICVAATNQNDALAAFSNFGAESVHLAAPGVEIKSTVIAGIDREYLFEGFEEPLEGRWVNGGTANWEDSWKRVGAPVASGAWSIADSPDSGYLPGTHAWIDGPPFDLADGSDCDLTFRARGDVHASDGLYVDVTHDEAEGWTAFGPLNNAGPGAGLSNSSWRAFIIDLSAAGFDGAEGARIGFRLLADADDDVGEGVHVDHVSVVCTGSGPGYDFLSGTSMATPHVAGAAALVLSESPGMPVDELRSAILDSVDPLPGLGGRVASGGRLNVDRALGGEGGSSPDEGDPQDGDATQSGDPAGGDDGSDTGGEPSPDAGDAPPSGDEAQPAARPPRARIVRRPKRRSRQRVARFRFRAAATTDQRPVRFRCRLNRRKWRPCASPRRYRVKPGRRHVFRVRAISTSGDRGRPAVWRFRVRR